MMPYASCFGLSGSRDYGLDAAVWVAIAGIALSATATGVSMAQQQSAAKRNAEAQRQAADQAAEAARMEAQQEAQNAAQARAEAAREAEYQAVRERQQKERQRQIIGQQRADVAAAGLLLEGSPLYAMQETLRQTELGLLASRTESKGRQQALQREANQRDFSAGMITYGGQSRMRLGHMQAGIVEQQASDAFTGGLIGLGGQIVSGAGGAYRQDQYNQSLKVA